MSFIEIISRLLEGFGLTVLLFAVTLVVSIPLGFLISFGSMSKFKPLKYLTKGFIWIIRGSPLMLQVVFVTFIPMLIFGVANKDIQIALNISAQTLGFFFVAIAFIINYSCYFSEIFRSGIEGVNKGQYEAGKVLGMTKRQIFFKIVLLQVFKKTLPPVSNEVITLVKDTSLGSVVPSFFDLMVATNEIVNSYGIIITFVYAAMFYLLFNGLLTLLFSFIEKKMNFYKE